MYVRLSSRDACSRNARTNQKRPKSRREECTLKEKEFFFAFTLCLLTLARSWFKGNDRISNIPTVRIVSNRYFSCIKSLTNHRADTISLWVDYTNHFLINSMCNLILHGDYATWTSSHNYCSFRAKIAHTTWSQWTGRYRRHASRNW